ncbi:protein TolR [Guyparkeria hydrothermalis]|uniref:protein TolR n=1 Tax=Guyparkeria hydrothermalis TaxID=923 RepID=UPI00201FB836|nr:protein TolR [Guyparkeria hydrothermalis]MCL7744760.1 protein TolR [Guyparkeria hydrothermalis]
MARRTRRARRMVAEINVVPYIDVMLVLLVIFMVTAPMLQQGVEVEAPKAAASPLDDSDEPPLLIIVNQDGEYFVNKAENPDAPVSLTTVSELVAAARKVDPEAPVLVKGDRASNYDNVMRAMVAAQQGGATKVGLVTDSQPPQSNAEER